MGVLNFSMISRMTFILQDVLYHAATQEAKTIESAIVAIKEERKKAGLS